MYAAIMTVIVDVGYEASRSGCVVLTLGPAHKSATYMYTQSSLVVTARQKVRQTITTVGHPDALLTRDSELTLWSLKPCPVELHAI